MRYYLATGMVFYIIMCICYYKSFKGASLWEVIKGLIFGILLWPLAAALHIERLTR